MRRKNHSITNVLNQNPVRFDNFYLNRLLAYTAIINSLNYKWYKSSKRRFLLPNFYFTRSFYNFYNLFFSKNVFRKKIQPSSNYSLFNPFCFFEKKMFLKHVTGEDFFRSTNSYFFFYNNKNISFLKKDRFFFKKKYNVSLLNSTLFVSNSVDIDSDFSTKSNLFKKNLNLLTIDVDFDCLIFFYIYNMSLVEIYKIILILNFNNVIK